MSTAWENLVAGSTLEAGSAWDHLTHQGGGSGSVFIAAAVGGDVQSLQLSGDISARVLAGNIHDASIGGVILEQALSGNIQDQSLFGDIAAQQLSGAIRCQS